MSLLLALALLAPPAGPPLFAGERFPVPSSAADLDIGDVDGDGMPDLVFGSTAPEFQVAALLGDGAGGFGAVTSPMPATAMRDAVLADWNADGALDLVATGEYPGSAGFVATFLGDGAGHFAPAASSGTFQNPAGIAVGDFDADGRLDAAVALPSFSQVHVYFHAAVGHGFAPPVMLQAGSPSGQPVRVAAGDLSGDGRDDIAVANAATAKLAVLIAAGGTSFAPAVLHATANLPQAVLLGDLDADGRLDAVVSCQGSVTVLLGSGGGALAPAPGSNTLLTSDHGERAALADFDGDGILDLVAQRVAVPNQGAGLALYRGAGSGAFLPPSTYPTPNLPTLAAADLDRDLLPDLVAGGSGRATVFAGKGGGALETLAAVPASAGQAPFLLASADLDGDGAPDVLATSAAGLLLCSGTGAGLAPPALVAPTGNSTALVLADANGDGALDAFQRGFGAVTIALGAGNGDFGPAVAHPVGPNPVDVAAGDLDGDGLADALIANYGDPAHLPGAIAGTTLTALLASEGYAVAHDATVLPYPGRLALDDFDADGDLDAAVAHDPVGPLAVLLGDGAGGFGPASSIGSVVEPAEIATADANADGRPDIAVGSDTSSFVLWIESGPGATYLPQQELAFPGAARFLRFADVTADGTADLVGAGLGSQLSVAAGAANGAFQEARPFQADASVAGLAVADFDQDGRLDCATSGSLPLGIGIAFHERGSAIPYGQGCPGSGGFAPVLALTGALEPGGSARLVVQQGNGGAAGLLFLGAAPASLPLGGGCTLLTAPLLPAALPLALGGTGAGGGTFVAPAIALPAGLALPLALRLQALLADPGAPLGFTASNAVLLEIS